ncbi:hypothetical protein [Candidatus Poriferisodalis sp.]|uniref:hypothetical protein n=1 Tax=Candidatus Poriferisodalis sp. TaxID=3101277 RepID=UPI003D0ECD92
MVALGDADGYKLAYEAGLHAVAEQASILRETRDRAGALLSVAAVAGGLAAGLFFTDDRSADIGWLALAGAVLAVAGFSGIVLSTVMIWRPVEGQFVHDAGVIVGSYIEGDPPADLPELHRELALWLGHQTDFNRHQLSMRLKWFNRGLLFLPVEVVGVIVALGDTAHG